MKNLFALLFCVLAIGFVSCGGDDELECKKCEATIMDVLNVHDICELEGGMITYTSTADSLVITDTLDTTLSEYITGLESAGYTCN